MHNIRNKISNTHRNSFRTVSQMSGAFTLLMMLTAYANGSALSSGQQASGFRTVEQLPVDRFDEYEAGKLPPHPWRLIGAEPGMLPKGIELALLADGESLFPGNKITGKGLVFRTKSMTEGTHGVGIATSFVPPRRAMFTSDLTSDFCDHPRTRRRWMQRCRWEWNSPATLQMKMDGDCNCG